MAGRSSAELPDVQQTSDNKNAVKVADTHAMGQGLLAVRDFKMGEIVLSEAPAALVKAALLRGGDSAALSWIPDRHPKLLRADQHHSLTFAVLVKSPALLADSATVRKELRPKWEPMDHAAFRSLAHKFKCTPEDIEEYHMKVRNNCFCVRGWETEVPVALAFYTLAQKTNHSCEPNCEVFFSERGFVNFMAVKPISKDEEITFSYIGHCLGQPVGLRKSLLRDRFFFDCVCAKCTAEIAAPDRSEQKLSKGSIKRIEKGLAAFLAGPVAQLDASLDHKMKIVQSFRTKGLPQSYEQLCAYYRRYIGYVPAENVLLAWLPCVFLYELMVVHPSEIHDMAMFYQLVFSKIPAELLTCPPPLLLQLAERGIFLFRSYCTIPRVMRNVYIHLLNEELLPLIARMRIAAGFVSLFGLEAVMSDAALPMKVMSQLRDAASLLLPLTSSVFFIDDLCAPGYRCASYSNLKLIVG